MEALFECSTQGCLMEDKTLILVHFEDISLHWKSKQNNKIIFAELILLAFWSF